MYVLIRAEKWTTRVDKLYSDVHTSFKIVKIKMDLANVVLLRARLQLLKLVEARNVNLTSGF